MARKLRIHLSGALYHCLNRGNRKKRIFLSDVDYLIMLDCLKKAIARSGVQLHGYCLMPNHFHLILQVHEVPLSTFMRSCLTRFAQNFNRRHHLTGHVFQGRYRAIVCQKEPYLLQLIRYIHLNPVRAHLVKSPQEWRWSSLNNYLDPKHDSWLHTQDVLSYFGKFPRENLLSFLSQAPDLETKQFYSPEDFPIGGDEDFTRFVSKPLLLRRQAPRSVPGPRPSLPEIGKRICARNSLVRSLLDHRHKGNRHLTQLRQEIIFAASHLFFYPIHEIASFLQISSAAVSQLQKKGSDGWLKGRERKIKMQLYQLLKEK